MSDRFRKLLVPGVFGTVIAGVWTLGALKADLDGPSPNLYRVDPSIVQRAVLAGEADVSAQAVADSGETRGAYYWLAG